MNCGKSLEPPKLGRSNECPQSTATDPSLQYAIQFLKLAVNSKSSPLSSNESAGKKEDKPFSGGNVIETNRYIYRPGNNSHRKQYAIL